MFVCCLLCTPYPSISCFVLTFVYYKLYYRRKLFFYKPPCHNFDSLKIENEKKHLFLQLWWSTVRRGPPTKKRDFKKAVLYKHIKTQHKTYIYLRFFFNVYEIFGKVRSRLQMMVAVMEGWWNFHQTILSLTKAFTYPH